MGLLRLIPGLQAWQERREAMRELRDMQEREEGQLTLSDTNPIYLAKIKLELGDKVAAAALWEEALQRIPRFARKSHDSLKILLDLERFEEAEKLMLEGRKRSPGDPFFAGGYATVAERRRDYDEAIKRWARVRKKFPSYWRAWVAEASCLRQAGQVEKSNKLLAGVLKVVPDRVEVYLEQARNYDLQRDWERALKTWDVMEERFRFAGGAVGAARILQQLGRHDEAEERLKSARMRHPTLVEIPTALAHLALARDDTSGALWWWKFLRERFPLSPIGYVEEGRLLRKLQRFADAEEVSRAAIDRFPAESWPVAEQAEIAMDRQDWSEAAGRWARMRQDWPDRHEGYLRGADALAALQRHEEAQALRAAYTSRSGG